MSYIGCSMFGCRSVNFLPSNKTVVGSPSICFDTGLNTEPGFGSLLLMNYLLAVHFDGATTTA